MKRKFYFLSLALVPLLMLSACGGTASPEAQTAAQEAAAQLRTFAATPQSYTLQTDFDTPAESIVTLTDTGWTQTAQGPDTGGYERAYHDDQVWQRSEADPEWFGQPAQPEDAVPPGVGDILGFLEAENAFSAVEHTGDTTRLTFSKKYLQQMQKQQVEGLQQFLELAPKEAEYLIRQSLQEAKATKYTEGTVTLRVQDNTVQEAEVSITITLPDNTVTARKISLRAA